MTKGQSPSYDFLLKILVIGDSGVGKSCSLIRFCEDSFVPSFIPTIAPDFKIRIIDSEGEKLKMQIWEVAGQERFRPLVSAYLRRVTGILLMYDVTDRRSFESIRSTWLKLLEEHGPEGANKILVGNKRDMSDKRVVSAEEGEDLAKEFDIPFFEISCKANTNVEAPFLHLAAMDKTRPVVDTPEAEGTDKARRPSTVPTLGARPGDGRFRSSVLWPEPFFLIDRGVKLPLAEARIRSAVIEKEGIVLKRGRNIKNWRKRIFLLKDRRLFYFDEGEKQKGHVILNRAMIAVGTGSDRSFSFSLFVDNPFTSHTVYDLAAVSEEDFIEWLSVFQKVGARLVDKAEIQSSKENQGGEEEAPLMSIGGVEFLDGKTEFLVVQNRRDLQVFRSSLLTSSSVCTLRSLGTTTTELLVDDKALGLKKFIMKADCGAILFESEDRQKLLKDLAGVVGQPRLPSEAEFFEMFRDIYYSSCSILFTQPPEAIRLSFADKEMKGGALRDLSVKMVQLHQEDILCLCHGLRYYPFLSSLSLSRTNLTAPTLKILVEYIMEEGTVPALSKLDLSRAFDERGDMMQMVSVVLPLLRRRRGDFSLQVLNLSQNRLPPKAGAMIFEAIISGKENCSLQCLDLELNLFDHSVVPLVCKVLSVNTSLRSLNLAGNPLTGNGTADLVRALNSNRSIAVLDLVGCGLPASDENALKGLLQKNNGNQQQQLLDPIVLDTMVRKPLTARGTLAAAAASYSYDIFISYRASTDAVLARRLCDRLQHEALKTGRNVRCFLDKNDIKAGEDWEASFIKGLSSSRLFLPLISLDGLKPIETAGPDVQDNALFEYEMALELAEESQLSILPLFVGRYVAVEGHGATLLEKFGSFGHDQYPASGSKTRPEKPIQETIRQMLRLQGSHCDPESLSVVLPGIVRKLEGLLTFK